MNEYNEKDVEIDLVEIFRVLRSRVWAIVLVTALAMGIAAGYTMLFVTPMYTSTSTIYVKGTATITSVQDLTMGSQMTQDYKVVITSRPVLDQVINDLNLNMSFTQLRDSIAINNPTNGIAQNLSVQLTSYDIIFSGIKSLCLQMVFDIEIGGFILPSPNMVQLDDITR